MGVSLAKDARIPVFLLGQHNRQLQAQSTSNLSLSALSGASDAKSHFFFFFSFELGWYGERDRASLSIRAISNEQLLALVRTIY